GRDGDDQPREAGGSRRPHRPRRPGLCGGSDRDAPAAVDRDRAAHRRTNAIARLSGAAAADPCGPRARRHRARADPRRARADAEAAVARGAAADGDDQRLRREPHDQCEGRPVQDDALVGDGAASHRRTRVVPNSGGRFRRVFRILIGKQTEGRMAGSNDVMRVACSAAFVTVLVLSSRTAAACECLGGGPPCQNYFQVDAVFVGTVRAISTIGGTPDATFQRHSVTFTIERAFRGVEGMTVDVATGVGGGDCGYEFKAGERYLVYAYKNGRTGPSTSICSRTRPMSAAGDDLSFIERMP